MENRFKKGFLCVLSVALLSACQGGNPGSSSVSQSKESEPISSSSSTISPSSSSSSEPEVTSSQTSQTSETKESSSSEEPPIETSTISSSEEESSEYPPCDEHEYEESVYKKATIVEKGIKRFTCKNCGRHYDEEYYDLDEYSFENMTSRICTHSVLSSEPVKKSVAWKTNGLSIRFKSLRLNRGTHILTGRRALSAQDKGGYPFDIFG